LAESERIANLGNWELDLAKGALTWSEGVYRIFGQDPVDGSPSYESFLNLVHPDDVAALKASELQALEGGSPQAPHRGEAFFRLKTKNGEFHYFHQICEAVHTIDGVPFLLRGTTQDITQLKQTEIEAKRQAERSKVLMDSAYEAMFLVSPDGFIVDANDQACSLTGYPKNLLAGKHVRDIHLDTRSGQVEEAFSALKEDGTYRGHFQLKTSDGRQVPVDITSARLEGEGEPMYLSIVRDTSEQVARETALTAALAVAERASQAKSDFLSSMSHELRTPLNCIIGFSQLMIRKSLLAVGDKENIHEILIAGHHLLALINDILDLAKIESGRPDIQLETVDAGTVIIESCRCVEPLAVRNEIELQQMAGAEAGWVLADRTKLRQVLINLLANAIKYNKPGGRVTVKLAKAEGLRLRIEVADTGKGIKKEFFDELFEPFMRVGSNKLPGEGTGLGLPLSKRLVEAMGGVIGFESQYGIGSVFWVDLPMYASPLPSALVTSAAEPVASPVDQSLELVAPNITVLYVEDNPANLRLVVKLLLGRPGLRLVPAPTSELGLDFAKAYRPEIILLDINLPDMDGYELLTAFRNMPELSETKIIAVSANALPRDIDKGLNAGFDDYLTKPLDVDVFELVLANCVAQVLNKNK
jgi:PAS domain S-box-containing protein